MADVLAATRSLLASAKAKSDRQIAVDASAFLTISVDGALALLRRGDTVDTLRARILEHLAGRGPDPAPAPLPPHPGVACEDGPAATPEQRANAAAEQRWTLELDAGVRDYRRLRALKHSTRTAVISPCEVYRYRLDRVWGSSTDGRVCWVMLNPSTADGESDDATLKRILGFSAGWGYGALVVVNLFAYRTTYPTELARNIGAAIGIDADYHIEQAIESSDLVICGWGNSVAGPIVEARIEAILARIRAAGLEPHALAITADGAPRHPVRLRADLSPRALAELRAEIGQ